MFKGRYGADRLTFAMIIVALVLSVISAVVTMFFGISAQVASRIITGISTVLIVLAFLRAFSRDFSARQRELHKYSEFEYKLKSFIKTRVPRSSNLYKFYKCPKCGQKLRVPRGKGKVRITCSSCAHKFERRT